MIYDFLLTCLRSMFWLCRAKLSDPLSGQIVHSYLRKVLAGGAIT